MDIQYSIHPDGPHGIGITVDLTAFRIREEDIPHVLHLSPAQLDLVRQSRIPTYVKDGVNTLYFDHGCLRSHGYTYSTVQDLIRQKQDTAFVGLSDEDTLFTPRIYPEDPKTFLNQALKGHSVTLSYTRNDRRGKPCELVQVHVFPKLQKRFLQFKPIANDSHVLISRINDLQTYGGEENCIWVGNTPLRSFAKL